MKLILSTLLLLILVGCSHTPMPASMPPPVKNKRILPVCPENVIRIDCRQLTAGELGTTVRGHSDDLESDE